ncbi:MAG: PEP-CTERM sorting domain-containing protein [Pirellulaceae bacterium]
MATPRRHRITSTMVSAWQRVASSVPEPGSITLMLCGAFVGLLCWYRKRKI